MATLSTVRVFPLRVALELFFGLFTAARAAAPRSFGWQRCRSNGADDRRERDDRALRTLDYFDVWQLVPRIHVPVLLSAGGRDRTCPLETIQSVYDRVSGPRTLKVYPNLSHTSCVDFYNLSWRWLDENFRADSHAIP